MTQYISSSPPEPIVNIINRVIKREIECYILKSVLIEVYYQICKWKGIEFARNALTSFQKTVPFVPVELDDGLIQTAGILKCQHRTTLSYIDCMSISYCINNKMEFHTTEKTLKGIQDDTLNKLKVKKYRF